MDRSEKKYLKCSFRKKGVDSFIFRRINEPFSLLRALILKQSGNEVKYICPSVRLVARSMKCFFY